MKKELIGLLAAFTLASSVWCGTAFAADPSGAAGYADQAQLKPAITAQASKAGKVSKSGKAKRVQMYLVSKIGDTKISYNKSGLVTKRAGKYETKKYSYSKKRVKAYTTTTSYARTKTKVSYDKRGRVAKLKSSGSSSYANYTVSYSYGTKNRVKKATWKYASPSSNRTVSYTYGKKGRLTASKSSDGMKTLYGYDSKGNLTGFQAKSGSTRYVFNTYTYKNGRIAKRVQETNGVGGWTIADSYSYKKVSVPKKYVSLIKKQQRVLVGNPDSALPL